MKVQAIAGRSASRGGQWGVRKRATATAMGVVAVALLIGGFTLLVLLQGALAASTESGARHEALEVVVQMRDQGVAEAGRYIAGTAHGGQIVQILDPAGAVVAASVPSAGERPLTSLRPAPDQTQTEALSGFESIGGNDKFLVVATGVLLDDDPYTVVVAAPVQLLAETVSTVSWFLLGATPLLLLVVGVSVWLLVGRSLRQVERIRGQVSHIDSARLDERVDVPRTNDEIQSLALTMNKMLERLQSADREQRRFISDASHELRSPLATLRAGVEVAAADPSGETWHELTDILSEETSRMHYLVEDLLTLAKASDGGIRLNEEDVDLDDVVDRETRRLRSTSPHVITADLSPVRITGDARRVGQVLRNVLDNADRHAMSRIQISLNRGGGGAGAVITVDNDGDPVPEADRQRVFERFVRLDESRSREGGGSGLGLAIAAGIMAAHHGSIRATESPVGDCRFELVFPAPNG
ncbi:sensor histidine kinase [Pseudarthrobacter sp. MM222]|uniref:sensor histidine kinase n=1 Tax=Pseudarthrobacter sp. MM222 TaxID=3018929 RepID=UPI00221F82EA|nr:ATP-binding protein [Pseudarthrobacter sp. MM222]CAI3798255.1 Adaptive-response sensory-kinase SasA [Pseudarthrobacter sp. MM222]